MPTVVQWTVIAIAFVVGIGAGWWLRGEAASWCRRCGHPLGTLCDRCVKVAPR